MPAFSGGDRAVHYACAVCADLQVSRLRRVGPYDMADAQNPVYIITCTKEV